MASLEPFSQHHIVWEKDLVVIIFVVIELAQIIKQIIMCIC
jgi:hypothetical protein